MMKWKSDHFFFAFPFFPLFLCFLVVSTLASSILRACAIAFCFWASFSCSNFFSSTLCLRASARAFSSLASHLALAISFCLSWSFFAFFSLSWRRCSASSVAFARLEAQSFRLDSYNCNQTSIEYELCTKKKWTHY